LVSVQTLAFSFSFRSAKRLSESLSQKVKSPIVTLFPVRTQSPMSDAVLILGGSTRAPVTFC